MPILGRIPKRGEVLRFAQDFASSSDAQIVKEQLGTSPAGPHCRKWLYRGSIKLSRIIIIEMVAVRTGC